jgi:hypothetical protein
MPFHDMFGNRPLVDDLTLERTDAGSNLSGTQFAVAAPRKPGKKVKK